MHACILGASLDVDNRGVRALAVSTIRLIQMASPEASITFWYGSRIPGTRKVSVGSDETTVQVVNYRQSPRARLPEQIGWILMCAALLRGSPRFVRERLLKITPALRALDRADFIGDIRGGDSFSDIYGLRRFVLGSLPSLAVLLQGRPLVLLPQTYGPFRSRLARWIARFIVTRAKLCLARDSKSCKMAEQLSGSPDKVRFCPDVAFLLPSDESYDPDFEPPLEPTFDLDTIGVNVSGLLHMGGYTHANMFGLESEYRDVIRDLIGRLLEETSAHILLMPHTFGTSEAEVEANAAVWRDLSSERVHLMQGEHSESVLKHCIGQCNFFIGSRMHACIGALSQGIPAVGLAYSDKFHGVFDSVGVGDLVIDLRTHDSKAVQARCLQLYRQRAELADSLKRDLPSKRRLLLDNLGVFISR